MLREEIVIKYQYVNVQDTMWKRKELSSDKRKETQKLRDHEICTFLT